MKSPPQRRRASVAGGFVTGMLSGLRAAGVGPAARRAGDGLERPDLAGRVALENYAALYNAIVRRLDDEGFALFSRALRTGTFEFLCRALMGSRSLGEALHRASRFLRIVLPDLEVTIERRGAVAELEIAERRRLRAHAADPRRAHSADYALVYTEHSTFGARSLVATMDAALLDLPVRRDEAELAVFLEGAPGKIAMLYRRDREMVRTVRELLSRNLPAAPSLGDVARELGFSPRPLHRPLHAQGPSYP